MSQTTSTQADSAPPPYLGPGITVETKLMKQYRLSEPVPAGKAGVAVTNRNGQVELFTIGANNTIWNIYPDPSSDTGYRSVDTHVHSSGPLGAGLDSDGTIVVFGCPPWGSAPFPISLIYAVKGPNGAWSKSTLLPLPAQVFRASVSGAPVIWAPLCWQITDIRAQTIDGKLYVAVVGVCYDITVEISGRKSTYTPPYLAVSNWSETPGSFQADPIGWTSLLRLAVAGTGFWTRTAQSPTPAFSVLIPKPNDDTYFYTVDLRGNLIETVTAQGGGVPPEMFSATVDIHSARDRFGRNSIFCWSPWRGFTRLGPHGSGANLQGISVIYYHKPATWFWGGGKVHAAVDHKGATHLFLVAADTHRLYHVPLDSQSSPIAPTDPQSPPLPGVPIGSNVAWITVARNADGHIELFCAQIGVNAPLIRLTLDQATGGWTPHPVEIELPGERDNRLEEFISYSTDIALTDTAGVPLSNTPVTIRASDSTSVTVNNNATKWVNDKVSAQVTTDALGKLTITQATSGLGVPDLWLHVDKLMPAGQVLVLQQYANGRDDNSLPKEMKSVQARLKDVTADELKNAKDASGRPLLKASFRNDAKNTTALASAFHDCMNLRSREPNTVAAALHPLISRKGTWTGLHIEPEETARARSRIVPHDGLPCWSLSFDEDGVKHQRLTPQEAETLMAEMNANARPHTEALGGEKSWWSAIGDFFQSIVEGIVQIGRVIVNGVRAAFEFVLDGVKYVFNAVVQFMQESFALLESILASAYDSVVGFFERTFEWIGFLFDWPDILRTRDALAHVVNETLKFIEMAAPAIRKRVDTKFDWAKGQIGTYFDNLIAQTGNQKNFRSVVKENERDDPVVAHSFGNNVVGNALMSNWQSTKAPRSPLATVSTQGLNDVWQSLQEFTVNTQDRPEWQKTATYFKTGLGSTQDGFLSEGLKTLYGLLRELAVAIMSGTQAIIDKLLEAMKVVIAAVRQTLTHEVHIPLVSELFQTVAHSPLTPLNLMALLAAIPTTVLYKAIEGAAPFPDEASVRAFKAAFTAQRMFDASGLGAPRATALADDLPEVEIRKKLRVACGSMAIIFGGLSAILDGVSGGATESNVPALTENLGYEFVSMAALLMEAGVQGCNCPYIFEESPHWTVQTVWFYETIGGLGLDAIFILKDRVLAKNSVVDAWGVGLAAVYGLGHLGWVIGRMTQVPGEEWAIMIPLAEISRFLLLKPILLAPEPIPALAIGAVVVLTLIFFVADGAFKIESASTIRASS